MTILITQVYNLGELANVRKTNLKDNADYLFFMWMADVIESWIAGKEAHVRSVDKKAGGCNW